MAKLSISVPDEVVADLHTLAKDNVSAFVTTAIRHELDRRGLFGFLDELESDLGPPDEAEVAAFVDAFLQVAALNPVTDRRRLRGKNRPKRRSASG